MEENKVVKWFDLMLMKSVGKKLLLFVCYGVEEGVGKLVDKGK